MADYYQLLGINSNASEYEIRAAYRKMAKLYHPDVNKAPDAHSKFVMLTMAYETLIDTHKRSLYNLRKKSSELETYNEWLKKQKARAEYEARLRYEEFLRNRQKFRESKYYPLAILVTHVARIISMAFGAAIIVVCLFLIYNIHLVLLFFLLPFICGGVYLIKWTNDWYKETRRYF